MGHPPVKPPHKRGQGFGENPTRDLPPDHPLIRMFGNYQPNGHSGEDYPGPKGIPVYATEDGVVTWVGPGEQLPGDNSHEGYVSRYYLSKDAAGNVVAIDHKARGGYTTLTYHLDAFAPGLKPFQDIKRGQLLGYCGETGRSTGPHAHLDVIPHTYPWDNGHYGRVDPAPYVSDPWPTDKKEPAMPQHWVPGAVQRPQPLAVPLDTSLPPRAVWHITSDVDPGRAQPPFVNVANYLTSVNYCPHLMWDPFTGYMEQYYSAAQGARALANWNQDGRHNFQIEILFSAGAIRDGKRYDLLAQTPLKGFGTILAFLDQLGIPRTWPMGPPPALHTQSTRNIDIWNTKAGHYGHVHVPGNDHTDPGLFPPLTTAAPPKPPAPKVVKDSGTVHVVAPGQSLSQIAEKHGTTVDAIRALNAFIKNPDYLNVGDRIKIPERYTPALPVVLKGVPAYVHRAGVKKEHVVAAGQTLAAIAKHYGSSVDWITRTNNLSDPNKISVGQRLRVR